jgi:hypothetical protein
MIGQPRRVVLSCRNVLKSLKFYFLKVIQLKVPSAKKNEDGKTMKRALIAVFCVIALCSLLAVPLLLHPANPPDPLQRAVASAIDFLEGTDDPNALLMLDIMHRRFGIAEFADALQRYDQVEVEGWRETAMLRVFRRIADYSNPLQTGDLEAVYIDIDRLTVPALYCNRQGLPPNYTAMLNEAVTSGKYLLTHALLACIWIQENGCEVPMPDGFIEDVYHANAALIGDDSVVDDLELEAAAFLYLAGQGALVNQTFVERVIAVQNYDGGWLPSSDTPGESHWHATVLGLMLLLHVEYPSDSYPPMLAPPPP